MIRSFPKLDTKHHGSINSSWARLPGLTNLGLQHTKRIDVQKKYILEKNNQISTDQRHIV